MLSARHLVLLVVMGVISSLSSALSQPITAESDTPIEEVRFQSPKHTDYVKMELSGGPRKLLKVVADDVFESMVSRLHVMGVPGHAATPVVQSTKTSASETHYTFFNNPCAIAARDYDKCRHDNHRNRKLMGAKCALQHDLAIKCVMDNPTAGKDEPAAGG
eukprot:CAMPEP_0198212620 /NCGR_PEP_ID=MMETSP1445-20131203/26836_1 /TAXON_ID=36898 /ORGANISM="Pyramimonas sp., Strain CCMP2087" /LENGTH=160 /DNA_ID=CAMNT_0043887115 /DNA_START=100 /DNA_END=582 /DNA_ORIENTATION=-